jgi:hypothetical protein
MEEKEEQIWQVEKQLMELERKLESLELQKQRSRTEIG